MLFVSSRAFSLSTPTFLLSTPVENSDATWKKATKCNKSTMFIVLDIYNVWHSMTAENMYMNTTRIEVISYNTYLLVVDIYVKNNFFPI